MIENLEQRKLLAVLMIDSNGMPVCSCGVCGGSVCTKMDRMDSVQEANVDIGLKIAGTRVMADPFGGHQFTDQMLSEAQIADALSVKPVSTFSTNADRAGGTRVAGSQYDIQLRYLSNTTSAQRAAFESAVETWETIILGDLRDVNVSGFLFDDLVIDVTIAEIDGPGGTLGFAGPLGARNGGADDGIAYYGRMTFDSADVQNELNAGRFDEIAVHEMGHIIGIGVGEGWSAFRQGTGTSNVRYTGPNAVAEYNRLRRSPTSSIEVENSGGDGTRDSHWRENVFGNELMTGFINNGFNPLSRMTAGALIDFGYNDVNPDAADLYEIPGASTSSGQLYNALPNIGSLTDSPDPGGANGITLTANNVSDSDGIARVEFFRESNGIPGLQSSTSNPDTAVGIDTNASGGYRVSLAANSIPEGTSTYYARSVDNFGAFSAIRTTTNTFVADSTPPQLVSSVFDFDGPQERAIFVFNEPLGGFGGVAATLFNFTTNSGTTAVTAQIPALARNTLIVDLSSGLLANGNYRLTLPVGYVDDTAGNDAPAASLDFFVLRGDLDRDRDVDLFDAARLERNFGRTDGPSYSLGNIDYDNDVDLFDAALLERNFGMTLPPLQPAVQAAPTPTPQDGNGGARRALFPAVFSGRRLVGDDDSQMPLIAGNVATTNAGPRDAR